MLTFDFKHYTVKIFVALCILPQLAYGAVPDLTLANVYSKKIVLSDYWASEKYDGVRAYWDGSALFTRRGNKIFAPEWFIESLPQVPLDGELWGGYGKFDFTSGTIRQHEANDTKWSQITYLIFELPSHASAYPERYNELKKIVKRVNKPFIKFVRQTPIKNETWLHQLLDDIVIKGGEGVMLRHISKKYEAGRNNSLIKLKRYHDEDAVVVNLFKGKGRYAQLMGSIEVENAKGQRFKIGTGFSIEERKTPPKIGDMITYRYTGYTQSGLPRFPSFIRVRPQY